LVSSDSSFGTRRRGTGTSVRAKSENARWRIAERLPTQMPEAPDFYYATKLAATIWQSRGLRWHKPR